VPDLALIGLADDTIDAADEALNLIDGLRPHRAYAMVRIAFEAGQRLIVLASSDIGRPRDLDMISRDTFLRQYREQQEFFLQQHKKRAPGGDFYNTQRSPTGDRFARALVESALEAAPPRIATRCGSSACRTSKRSTVVSRAS
jgi:hypothetical protein